MASSNSALSPDISFSNRSTLAFFIIHYLQPAYQPGTASSLLTISDFIQCFPGLFKIRINFQGFVKLDNGLIYLLRFHICPAEVIIQILVARIYGQRLLVFFDRFLEFSLLAESDTQPVVYVNVLGVSPQY